MLAFPKLTSPSRTQPASAKQLQLIRDLGMDHDRLDAATVTKVRGGLKCLVELSAVEVVVTAECQCVPMCLYVPMCFFVRRGVCDRGANRNTCLVPWCVMRDTLGV